MTEIFTNISDEVKEIGRQAWNIVLMQEHPDNAAEFLNNIIEYYTNILSEEEIEFLQFYFQMQMEMMKE